MTSARHALLRQLSENSAPYRDPLAAVNWTQLTPGGWWLPESALSLHGLPEFSALALETRQALSRIEFFNVMQCGLWLESVFLQRMSRRLRPDLPPAEREYLLHELREEAGHSLTFLRALEQGGMGPGNSGWRPPLVADTLGRLAPAGSRVFWLAMLVGEDMPDKFNRYVRGMADGVNPAVRQICSLHVTDEARHIAAARRTLGDAVERAGPVRRALLSAGARLLLRELIRVFYFPPARYYEMAGLAPGSRWRSAALGNPARRKFIAERVSPTLRVLTLHGLRAAL